MNTVTSAVLCPSALLKDANGGLTLYVENESLGADKEANSLPAPKRAFRHVHAPLPAETRRA
jgi:hypothetical protein